MSWLINSSIGRKVVQSLSGLFLILFLLFHMCMNVVLIFNYETYDFLANEILGANWWAIVGTLIIALGVVIHILYGIILTLQNQKARGKDKYASSSKTPQAWSSKNMFVLGLVILIFVLLHLYQMWYEMQFKELFHISEPEPICPISCRKIFATVGGSCLHYRFYWVVVSPHTRFLECATHGGMEQYCLDETN